MRLNSCGGHLLRLFFPLLQHLAQRGGNVVATSTTAEHCKDPSRRPMNAGRGRKSRTRWRIQCAELKRSQETNLDQTCCCSIIFWCSSFKVSQSSWSWNCWRGCACLKCWLNSKWQMRWYNTWLSYVSTMHYAWPTARYSLCPAGRC